MKENRQQIYTGERAQFFANGKRYTDCIFEDGESPLKHASNIELQGSMFRWKYPLWYTSNVTARDCTWFDMARAGVWYTKNIALERALIEAPKNFRRCEGLCLEDVSFSDAAETLWNCRDVRLSNVTASRADYFAMNCENMTVDNLTLYGNYTFDGAKKCHDPKFKAAFQGCLLEQRKYHGIRFVYFRRISGLEFQKSDADQLHGGKPAGHVLY